MRDSFQLRKRKEMVVLGIRGIKFLTYVMFMVKLPTWRMEEFMMNLLVLDLTLLVRSW